MARPVRLLVVPVVPVVPVVLALLALATPADARPAPYSERPGRSGDHTFLFQDPVAWPSCGALTYRVNPSKAPRAWKPLVRTAVRKAHQATGLRFRYLGTTTAKPTHGGTNPDGTDLVVAFLVPGQTDMLGGPGVAGEGGAATDGSRLFDGKIVLNGAVLARMADGFGQGPRYGIQGTRGQVVMHELGHALGLGHARERTQVMYPTATRKPADWGAGDWAGLRRLGQGGCDQPAAGRPRAHALP
ncbi:matrixin family metalloprotease [Nocardioides anomalus]|uniref:Matrixin family metalloprotease n=1 Tax=Nocardioides anomalus TaxID=2712223 RepID=A0A6G6WHZ3_9ACTN|nr:matrixin family metalloprotease [Nocardioides anomalus]QIG44826.1 matrixin family metalloprotease [Nocardioides anomalus]